MMDYLYNNSFKTISMDEFNKWYKGEIEFSSKTLMITFDDGQYEDYYLAYPIIKKYNFKATSFITGSLTSNKTKEYNKTEKNFIGLDIINKVRKEYPNFEFQSHSYNMHLKINNKPKIFLMNLKELEADIQNNRKFNFSYFAYPYGSYNDNIIDLLYKHNYSLAFIFTEKQRASRNNNRFLIPRIKISDEYTLNKLKRILLYT